jgi:hypothetical protein
VNDTLADVAGAAVNHNLERSGGVHRPDPGRHEHQAQYRGKKSADHSVMYCAPCPENFNMSNTEFHQTLS